MIVRSARGAAALFLVAGLGLAGCSGSPSKSGEPSATASAAGPIGSTTPAASRSARPAPVKPAPPAPPAAMKRTDDKGAIAFFDYYLAVYSYAYLTVDPAPLDAISETGCKFCAEVKTDINDLRARDRTAQGGQVSVDWATTPKGEGRYGAYIAAAISQKLLLTFGPGGQEASRDAPVSGQRVDAVVRLTTHGWVLMELSVIKPSKP